MRDRHSRSVMMRNKGLPCAVGHFILTGDSASSISGGGGDCYDQNKFLLQIELASVGRPVALLF